MYGCYSICMFRVSLDTMHKAYWTPSAWVINENESVFVNEDLLQKSETVNSLQTYLIITKLKHIIK